MKVIIAGGRDYTLDQVDRLYIDSIASAYGISEVVCGEARGADTGGKEWANDRDIAVKSFPADWDKYKRGAGPVRNREMAEYADAVILFSGGRGTNNMFETALNYRLKIYDRRFM